MSPRRRRGSGWTLVFDGAVFEADVLQAVLETRGLTVQRTGGAEVFSAPGVGRAFLFVPDPDEETARAILADATRPDQGEGPGEDGAGPSA